MSRSRSPAPAEKLPVSMLSPEQAVLKSIGGPELNLGGTTTIETRRSSLASPPTSHMSDGAGSPFKSAKGDDRPRSRVVTGRRGSLERSARSSIAEGAPSTTVMESFTVPIVRQQTAESSESTDSPPKPAARRRSMVASGPGTTQKGDASSRPAILLPTFQWKYIDAQPSNQDKPALRHEIKSLIRRFEAAMQHYGRILNQATASVNANLNVGDPILDQDVSSCKILARRIFMERVLPGSADPLIGRATPETPEISRISQPGISIRTGPEGQQRSNTGTLSYIPVLESDVDGIVDMPVFQDAISELAITLYEHKWTDLTLGEAEDQIAASSHEHGVLLHAIRAHYGNVCHGLMSTILRLTLGLQQALVTIKAMEKEVVDARKGRELVEQDIRQEYDQYKSELESSTRRVKEAAAADVAEAQAQVEKLAESLRALNAVFKKMRGEDDILKLADLKETAARLERKLTERTRELEALQPIKVQLRKTETDLNDANKRIAQLESEAAEMKRELAKQTALSKAAVQASTDSALLDATSAARQDAAAKGTAGLAKAPLGAAVKPLPSGRPKLPELPTQAAAAVNFMSTTSTSTGEVLTDRVRGGVLSAAASLPGLEFLCARCNSSLAAAIQRQEGGGKMDSAAAKLLLAQLAGHADKPYMPCLNYRIMLPALPALPNDVIDNILGHTRTVDDQKFKPSATSETASKQLESLEVPYPKRSTAWIRWCMRALLLSKMRDNALVTSGRPDGAFAPGGRIRFPEYVFAWFAGNQLISKKPVNPMVRPWMGAPGHDTIRSHVGATMGTSGPATAVGEEWGVEPADEARWAFYFGVRQLARDDAEAKLFYSLLDERHGEDEETFFMYCIHMMDFSLPSPIAWGPTWASCDFGDIPPVLEDEDAVLKIKHRILQSREADSLRTLGKPLDSANAQPKASFTGRRASQASQAPTDTDRQDFIDIPQDNIWIPLSFALYAAARILERAPQAEREAVLQRIRSRSVSSDGRLASRIMLLQPASSTLRHLKGMGGEESVASQLLGTPYQPRVASETVELLRRRRRGLDEADARCIDLHVWLRVLLLEYREEQARRRATIKIMFDIALTNSAMATRPGMGNIVQADTPYSPLPLRSSGKADRSSLGAQSVGSSFSDGVDRMSAGPRPASGMNLGGTQAPGGIALKGEIAPRVKIAGLTMSQLILILKLIAPEYPASCTATLFRDAYVLGSGTVDYDSFMAAAEQRQFFSYCLQLPPLMGTDRGNTLTTDQGTQLAYLVIQRVACLDRDLQPWLSQLPPPWARVVHSARRAVQAEIDDGMAPTPIIPSADKLVDPGTLAPELKPDASVIMGTARASVSFGTNSVNMLPDGRRMLSAYRRFLQVLHYMRTCFRADRGEAGGPKAVRAVTDELDRLEEVLRSDASALAPDVQVLKRMARAGIPLRVQTLLSRPPAGLGKGAMPESDGTDLSPPSEIPLDPPYEEDISEVSAEEYAIRLGVETQALDPIVTMRSHEAIVALKNAARTASLIKLRRAMVRAVVATRLNPQTPTAEAEEKAKAEPAKLEAVQVKPARSSQVSRASVTESRRGSVETKRT